MATQERKTRSDRKPIAVRECAACGIVFEFKDVPSNSGRKFCSRECSGKSVGSPPVARECKQCGMEFLASAYEVAKGRGAFCSKKCNHDYGHISLSCKACGKQFSTIKAKGSRKFCSRECSDGGMSRKRSEPQMPRTCQCCGIVFLVRDTVQGSKRKYCSKDCGNKAQRKPPEQRVEPFRKTSAVEYQAWVKAVLLRDRACVRCGATETLQAHHVKHWRNHPELRYDIDNGVALCPYCHHAQHQYLSLEAFLKQGGRQVLHCVVCESPYVPRGRQRTCSARCGQKRRRLREKLCQS